ncbi:MAG: hypothetical protein WBB29_18750 [Geitlerinemataceae cyanobacterium]
MSVRQYIHLTVSQSQSFRDRSVKTLISLGIFAQGVAGLQLSEPAQLGDDLLMKVSKVAPNARTHSGIAEYSQNLHRGMKIREDFGISSPDESGGLYPGFCHRLQKLI